MNTMLSQGNDDSSGIKAFQNQGKNLDEIRIRRSKEIAVPRKASEYDDFLQGGTWRVAGSLLSSLSIQENTPSSAYNTVEEIIEGMSSSDDHVLLVATQSARMVLCCEKNPLIDVLIKSGMVSRCVEFLSHFHNPSLQFEAAWALTNVASGAPEQTRAVVEAGAVPKLVNLLSSPEMQVAEQAVWALGNIAGDGPKPRDLLLGLDVTSALLDLIKPDINITFLRNIVWSISTLCLNKNLPPAFDKVKICLPVLGRLLYHNDTVVLAFTSWTLSYLTEGSKDKIQCVLDTGVVPKLMELLGSSEQSILTPALRAVGNIATGSDIQTDVVIHAGVLEHLRVLLRHEHSFTTKEAAWTVSNITAGNVDQIQAVLDCGVMEPLFHVLACGDFESQREAAYAITNFTRGGSLEQFLTLIELGVLETFCSVLDSKHYETLMVFLDGIKYFLKTAVKIGETERVAIMIEDYGGLKKLKRLQNHENETVCYKSLAIISRFFSEEDLQNRRASKRYSA